MARATRSFTTSSLVFPIEALPLSIKGPKFAPIIANTVAVNAFTIASVIVGFGPEEHKYATKSLTKDNTAAPAVLRINPNLPGSAKIEAAIA